ncbi:hypothetical protein EYB31_13260 [Paenibacillus thalictri]|uniref:Uncharacterized protein n=2 Tax=Paenibacillus thalictri TaxID=2527873 RepID=A0A4Q9DT00_9BACL|nr:hypothetical protein EYB31_13260 [Paenibacillus thalictri]
MGLFQRTTLDQLMSKQAVHYEDFDYILRPLNRKQILSALERAKTIMRLSFKGREDVLNTVPVAPQAP